MDRALRIALAAAVAATACGSDDPTLSVDLRTDLTPGVEFRRIRTTVEAGVPEPLIIDTEIRSDDDFVSGTRVAEFEGLPPSDYLLRVELLAEDGAIVVGRSVLVSLGDSVAATVVLTRSCRGMTCPGPGDPVTRSACLGARCVEPRCTEETSAACGAAACATSADCPAAAACAEPACTGSGACLLLPGPCGAGEACVPELGCVLGPGSSGDGDG